LILAKGSWKRNFYSHVMARRLEGHTLGTVFSPSFSVLPACLGLTILDNHLIYDLPA